MLRPWEDAGRRGGGSTSDRRAPIVTVCHQDALCRNAGSTLSSLPSPWCPKSSCCSTRSPDRGGCSFQGSCSTRSRCCCAAASPSSPRPSCSACTSRSRSPILRLSAAWTPGRSHCCSPSGPLASGTMDSWLLPVWDSGWARSRSLPSWTCGLASIRRSTVRCLAAWPGCSPCYWRAVAAAPPPPKRAPSNLSGTTSSAPRLQPPPSAAESRGSCTT